MSDRPGLAVVVPVAPARSGNGLAMRAWTLVRAAATDHAVHLVLVPLHGDLVGAEVESNLASVRRVPLSRPSDRRLALALAADPVWRQRMGRMSPVPDNVARASPDRAGSLAADLHGLGIVGVLGFRLAVAPLALGLAEHLGVPLVVDADDDDERLFRDLGDRSAAEDAGRVAAVVLPEARLVLAAAAADAGALAARHHLAGSVEVLANAAPLPGRRPSPPPGGGRLLFVGNLTYAPNVEAAHWLVDVVLPLLPEDVSIDLVGAAGADIEGVAGDRVAVNGAVPEVAPHYAVADVAVAPLLHGAGSRIKVLEAFAHRRPVVATTAGAAGLDARAGEHLLVADEPGAFADAVGRAREPAVRDPLVEAGSRLAGTTYHPDTVIGHGSELLAGAFGGRGRV